MTFYLLQLIYLCFTRLVLCYQVASLLDWLPWMIISFDEACILYINIQAFNSGIMSREVPFKHSHTWHYLLGHAVLEVRGGDNIHTADNLELRLYIVSQSQPDFFEAR